MEALRYMGVVIYDNLWTYDACTQLSPKLPQNLKQKVALLNRLLLACLSTILPRFYDNLA